MPTSTIISDNGVVSGTTGLKTAGGDDGTLILQTTTAGGTATTALTISNTQVTTLANALPAGSGGTGANTLTSENVIIGNGTSAVKFVAPGTTGNVLTSNGSAWLSQAAAGGGDYIMQVFVGPSTGTWTKPAGLKAIKVTVIGGGGSSGSATFAGGGGSGGGSSIEYIDAPAIPGPQPYTAGGGGAVPSPSGQGAAGGTSSFGSPAFLSATGGTGVYSPSPSINSGGVGSGGQLNIGGGMGLRYNMGCPGYLLHSGGSILGTAGAYVGPGLPTPTSGFTASDRGYGAGAFGNGVSPAPSAGFAGGPGVVIVEEFY
jgi:hypothetical protein